MVNLTPAIEVVESLEDSVVFRSSTIPSMEWRFLARTLRGAGGDCKAGGPGSLTWKMIMKLSLWQIWVIFLSYALIEQNAILEVSHLDGFEVLIRFI